MAILPRFAEFGGGFLEELSTFNNIGQAFGLAVFSRCSWVEGFLPRTFKHSNDILSFTMTLCSSLPVKNKSSCGIFVLERQTEVPLSLRMAASRGHQIKAICLLSVQLDTASVIVLKRKIEHSIHISEFHGARVELGGLLLRFHEAVQTDTVCGA